MNLIDKTRTVLRSSCGKWKIFFISFIHNAPAVILTICVIMCIVSIVCFVNTLRSRPERNASSVWGQGSEASFRHMAVYANGSRASGDTSPATYSEYGKSLAKTDIYNIRKTLQGTVDSAAGIRRRANDRPSDPEGWEDCYCSFANANISCNHQDFNVSSDAAVYAVGGNFKVFHPMEFMSGGFLPTESVDKYQIVLNDELAWRFFSSYDVIGERVSLWGKEFTIIGVVREHNDKSFRAYVYFDCLEEYCASSEEKLTPAVMCYEAMMPEPMKGAAVIDVRNAVPGYDVSSPSFYVVSITDRFSLKQIWDHMMPPGHMREFLQGYELPYWEMSAQSAITTMFVWMVVFVFFIVLALCMVIMLIRGKTDTPKPVSE